MTCKQLHETMKDRILGVGWLKVLKKNAVEEIADCLSVSTLGGNSCVLSIKIIFICIIRQNYQSSSSFNA